MYIKKPNAAPSLAAVSRFFAQIFNELTTLTACPFSIRSPTVLLYNI